MNKNSISTKSQQWCTSLLLKSVTFFGPWKVPAEPFPKGQRKILNTVVPPGGRSCWHSESFSAPQKTTYCLDDLPNIPVKISCPFKQKAHWAGLVLNCVDTLLFVLFFHFLGYTNEWNKNSFKYIRGIYTFKKKRLIVQHYRLGQCHPLKKTHNKHTLIPAPSSQGAVLKP